MKRPDWLIDGFRQAMIDCDLLDSHFKDYVFTWLKDFENRAIKERLDRYVTTNV